MIGNSLTLSSGTDFLFASECCLLSLPNERIITEYWKEILKLRVRLRSILHFSSVIHFKELWLPAGSQHYLGSSPSSTPPPSTPSHQLSLVFCSVYGTMTKELYNFSLGYWSLHLSHAYIFLMFIKQLDLPVKIHSGSFFCVFEFELVYLSHFLEKPKGIEKEINVKKKCRISPDNKVHSHYILTYFLHSCLLHSLA
jgi:hypothetical protein